MRALLHPSTRAALDVFAHMRALFVFDFDGTLAPIVDRPSEAAMRMQTAMLLQKLARSAPCAIISGRGRDDLLPRISDIDLVHAVGNHGAEWGDDDAALVEELREIVGSFRNRLTEAVGHLEGVTIEDKGLSLALHLRGEAIETAPPAVLRALEPLGKARVFGGKRVVNVLPRGAPHKGTALLRMVDQLRPEAVLYVGDDTTDEDAFVNPGALHFLPVRVGPSPSSRATLFLRDQAEIDELLEVLVRIRSRP